MALSGLWSRLTGGIIGAGVGIAAAEGARPAIEPAAQEAWKANPFRVLDPATLAALVAQALTDLGPAEEQASRSGYDANKLSALVQLALKAPPTAEALELWRRGKISADQARHALTKAQIEPQYHDAILDLFHGRLRPEAVATAIQRGILPNDGILPVGPPTAVGVVEPMPQVALDPFAEAQADGLDADRLKVLARIVGLPPGPGELLDLLNRGVIEDADFYRGVAEGNIRNEWGPVLYQLRHYLLSPAVIATLRLKGWLTRDEANALGALRGAAPDVMDNLYLSQGRPAAPVQMFTAWARGVTGPDGAAMDFAQFEKGIRESDIRPEWGPMLWGIRYAYPSLFQLRRAVEDGSLSPARALVILRYERYEDQDAASLVASWTSGGAAAQREATKSDLLDEYEGLFITIDTLRTSLTALGYAPAAVDMEVHLADARRVKKARDAVIKAVHDAYLSHEIDEAQAAVDLAQIAISQPAIDSLIQLWGYERAAHRRTLTAAQIKRAYVRGVLALDQATAALENLGYSLAEASTYLTT